MFGNRNHLLGLFTTTILSLFMVHIQTQDIITFSPATPLCLGERVEMVCYIEPPAGEVFVFTIAKVSFNESDPATIAQINENDVTGVDLSRYSANIDGLTLTAARPGVRVIIDNYMPSDSDTEFGCHGTFSNQTDSVATVSDMPMRQADPPSPPVLIFSQPVNNCSNVLTWSTPSSDRFITSYSVYRNNVSIYTGPSTTNQYTDSDVTAVHMYSVIATSCAGNNTSNVVTSVSIGVPSSPLVTLPQIDINCSNTLISWSTPSSDRSITSYSVYRDDTLIYTGLANETIDNTQLSISTVYEYSVVAISCVGNSTAGVNNISIGTSLVANSLSISYDNTTGELLVDWLLSPSQPIVVEYILSVNFYIQNNMTYSYNQTYIFLQTSTDTNYTLPPNILPSDYVIFDATLTITQQCMISNGTSNHTINATLVTSPDSNTGLFVGIGVGVLCLCSGCVLMLTGITILIIFCCVSKKKGKEYSMFNSTKKSNSHELDEQTYSQVNNETKKSKEKPPVEEKKMKGLYADIDHALQKPDTVKKPEPIEETLYSKVHSIDGPSY